MSTPLIFLVAGEPSGDLIGARLMAALKRRGPVRFAGLGGPLMTAQGLDSLFPIAELSVMGFLEVLPHVPRLLRRIRETAEAARALRPAVVVTIDLQDFNLRLARRLAGAGFPLVHYVAPTVWAYRPGRAKRIARFIDHLLLLFPFEPPYFDAVGLPYTFVGHPLVEEGIETADGPGFRARHNIGAETRVLALLPGSRRSELARHLPVFRETLGLLAARLPGLRVVLPAVPALARGLAAERWPLPVIIVEGVGEKYAAMAASDAALSVSGTATLELAIAGVPLAVCYRAHPLTMALARRIVHVPYIAMPNLVAGREAAPEFIQGGCVAERLAPAIERLLVDADARHGQIEGFREIARRLGGNGQSPSARAAEAVLAQL